MPELAVFRRRQNRANPRYGEVRCVVPAHHHVDALRPRISTRRRMWCRARPSSTRCRCRISSARGIVVSLPKKKWELITADDLEKACGKAIRPHDVHHRQHRLAQGLRGRRPYFAYCPGFVPFGRPMDGRSPGQGRRPRHPGQRPSAGDRDRPAAQRPAAARIWPRNTRNGPAAMIGRTISPNGSQRTRSCSRMASSASRTSAATSTR